MNMIHLTLKAFRNALKNTNIVNKAYKDISDYLAISVESGEGNGHYLIIAPAGSGKTTCFVIPNAAGWDGGSLFVNDPKGEVFAVTARARKEKGHKVIYLKPGDKNSNRINILQNIIHNAGKFIETNVKALAEDLVKKPAEGRNEGQFFKEKVKNILVGIIMCEVKKWYYISENKEKVPTIKAYADLIKGGQKAIVKYCEEHLQQIEEWRVQTKDNEDAIDIFGHETSAIEAVLNDILSIKSNPETWSNIATSIQNDTAWLLNPQIAGLLCGNDDMGFGYSGEVYDFREMSLGKTSFYLCFNVKEMVDFKEAVQAVLGSVLNYYIEVGDKIRAEQTLFLLDEAVCFAEMKLLHDLALDQGRGYGIKIALIIQTEASFKKRAGDKTFETWFQGVKIKLFFGINDPNTAKSISDSLGDSTIQNVVFEENRNQHGIVNVVKKHEILTRKVLTPDELTRIPKGYAYFQVVGLGASIIKLPYYKDIPFLKGKFDENPYDNGKTAGEYETIEDYYNAIENGIAENKQKELTIEDTFSEKYSTVISISDYVNIMNNMTYNESEINQMQHTFYDELMNEETEIEDITSITVPVAVAVAGDVVATVIEAGDSNQTAPEGQEKGQEYGSIVDDVLNGEDNTDEPDPEHYDDADDIPDDCDFEEQDEFNADEEGYKFSEEDLDKE